MHWVVPADMWSFSAAMATQHDEMCTEISAPANGISSSDNSFENMFIPLIPLYQRFLLFLQDKCIRNITNAAWKHCRKAAVAVDDLATASC